MIFKLELSPQNFHYDVLYPLYSGEVYTLQTLQIRIYFVQFISQNVYEYEYVLFYVPKLETPQPDILLSESQVRIHLYSLSFKISWNQERLEFSAKVFIQIAQNTVVILMDRNEVRVVALSNKPFLARLLDLIYVQVFFS